VHNIPALDTEVLFWIQQGVAKSNIVFSRSLFFGSLLSFLNASWLAL
jgi:hypothetical protein